MHTLPDSCRTPHAYESLAAFYDDFTAHHDYEAWIAALEELAAAHGLRGRSLLDIACGTGKSFLPFLARGYRVEACDISPGMLARAAAKADGRARLFQADMRDLPPTGPVALAICLDDSLNYLLSGGDLRRAFASAARCLRPNGLYVFDVNTLGAYRTVFAQEAASEHGDLRFAWHGHASPDLPHGGLARATVEVRARGEEARVSEHVQRHHPHDRVEALLRAAGLRPLAVYGMTPDGAIHDVFDELAHTKRIHVAAPAADVR